MDSTVDQLWQQAAILFANGQYSETTDALDRLLAREPTHAAAWLALAHVDFRTGRAAQAAEHALAAARQPVADPGLLLGIAEALMTVGAAADAHRCVERAAAAAPLSEAIQQRVALQYQNLGLHTQALHWLQRASKAGLDDAANRFMRAVELTFHGQLDAAEKLLEDCAKIEPPFGRAMAQLAQLRRQTPKHHHLERLAAQLKSVVRGSEDHAAIEFARYKEFEDTGQVDQAWHSLEVGNAVMRALVRHDVDAEERTCAALVNHAARLAPREGAAAGGSPLPIFVIGLPRSGTTLLDRMLGNHHDVCSAGELGTFWRCLQRGANRFTGPMLDEAFVEKLAGADLARVGDLYLEHTCWRVGQHRFYVDKMPRNWLLAPWIHMAIPGARLLHMVRDPMDVAFSNYRSYFGSDYPYCYGANTLVSHYRQYRCVMQRWHALAPGAILDVHYEDLVADPEREMRRVLAFCGLPWQPGLSDLTRNTEPVATPSAVQVRHSVLTGLSERWRQYSPHLAVLRQGITAVVSELNTP